MDQSKHDDANLAEVKAVLDRLQRISGKPLAGSSRTAGDDAGQKQPAQTAPTEDGRSSPSVTFGSHVRDRRLLKAAVLIGALLAISMSATVFVANSRRAASVKEPADVVSEELATVVSRDPSRTIAKEPAPENAPAPEDKKPETVVKDALQLMASGRVQAARVALLGVTGEGSADVAWTLARSYDPNYLVTLRAADAGPDVAQATRWYRIWYDIAVKQGLVSDGVSLDRIIESMN